MADTNQQIKEKNKATMWVLVIIAAAIGIAAALDTIQW